MKVSYYLFRGFMFLISLLPFFVVRALGKVGGSLVYYFVPKFRKRCFSNLSLATKLSLTHKEMKSIARASLQNVVINVLEYAKFFRLRAKDFDQLVRNKTPHVLPNLLAHNKSAIIFCGHQANWELLFLVNTRIYPGAAIGRPLANKLLYNFILSIRQKFGGKIVDPKKALWEGVKAIKRGCLFGIVGDQAMLHGGYRRDFLDCPSWTSPLPAILAHRMQVPIVVATLVRVKNHYEVSYSEPIYPNCEASLEAEIPRLMDRVLTLFENSVCEHPEQWLWMHNRWKQRFRYEVKRAYRHEAIAIVLPKEIAPVQNDLEKLLRYYDCAFMTIFSPEKQLPFPLPEHAEIFHYQTPADIFVKDYRFKMVFDLSDYPGIKKHFLKLSVVKVARREEMGLLLATDEVRVW